MGSMLNRADGRPRVHLWPHNGTWNWSIGPTGRLMPGSTPGDALDAAIAQLGKQAAAGVVAIIETGADRQPRSAEHG